MMSVTETTMHMYYNAGGVKVCQVCNVVLYIWHCVTIILYMHIHINVMLYKAAVAGCE